jgi:hypothetical protein
MALFAVWLTALAPTISRTATVFSFPTLGAWCEGSTAMRHGRPADGQQAETDADAACGYCTLFTRAPALGSAFVVVRVAPAPAAADLAPPIPLVVHVPARFHPPPRGPPVATHAA